MSGKNNDKGTALATDLIEKALWSFEPKERERQLLGFLFGSASEKDSGLWELILERLKINSRDEMSFRALIMSAYEVIFEGREEVISGMIRPPQTPTNEFQTALLKEILCGWNRDYRGLKYP
ncbi:MAG: hypothetical protein Q7R46_00465, partial [bacterium]|nr:hypothetical protein [bacterium]